MNVRTLFWLALVAQLSAFGQGPRADYDALYGTHPALHSGKLYRPTATAPVFGHPFYAQTGFEEGTVWHGGIEYHGVWLNYDCHQQKLLLQFVDRLRRPSIIELELHRVSAFRLGQWHFVVLPSGPRQGTIYRSLGSDSLQLLVHRQKELAFTNLRSPAGFEFGRPAEQRYLWDGVRLRAFASKREFFRLFAEPQQAALRGYLKTHGLRWKRMSEPQWEDLLRYCATL